MNVLNVFSIKKQQMYLVSNSGYTMEQLKGLR